MRAHAADFVAKPAQRRAANRGAHEKASDDPAQPGHDLLFVGDRQEVLECRPTNQRDQADLDAVEHPA